MGVGKALQDKERMKQAADHLALIAGQKPQVTKARMAVSGFRLREGNEIGCRVTLRGRRMYEFLDRLVNVALPRIRDFRGVNPKSFDGNGNYSMGLTEQLVFPRSTRTRRRSRRAWTSPSSPAPATTTRPASCSGRSACRSGTRANSSRFQVPSCSAAAWF